MIATDTAATMIAQAKGQAVTVTMHDGTTLTGIAISVNSKGVNLNVDGKVVTRAISKIESIELTETKENTVTKAEQIEDLLEDIATEDAEATEGDAEEGEKELTTADLAAIFDMPAKELRVKLRRMNLNVGRGARYSFKQEDVETIREGFERIAKEDAEKKAKQEAEAAVAAEAAAKAEVPAA